MKMKHALDNDKRIPTELYKNKAEVQNDLELADTKTMVARSHVDDEYQDAQFRDPKLFITTSRTPSQRLISF